MHHFADMAVGNTWVDMYYYAQYVGLSKKDHIRRDRSETLMEFTERVLGYMLTPALVDGIPAHLPELMCFPKVLMTPAGAERQPYLKQTQLPCAVCMQDGREKVEETNPGAKYLSSNCPKVQTCCSLCVTGVGSKRTSSNCFPVHDPRTNSHKRHRSDPHALCWERHIRAAHPNCIGLVPFPNRIRSPTGE
jgi:hypothetical protein